MQTLSSRPNKKSDYIILRSEQLVGAALIILIKTSLATEIRNVEGATKKVRWLRPSRRASALLTDDERFP